MHILINDKASLDEFAQRVAPHTNMPVSRLKTAMAKSYQFKHITALESALSPANAKPPYTVEDTFILNEKEQSALLELSYWLDDCILLEEGLTFGDGNVTPSQVLSAVLQLIHPDEMTASTITPADRDILSAFSNWCHDNADNSNIANSMACSGVNKVTPAFIHALLSNLLNRTEKELIEFGLPTRKDTELDCLNHFNFDSVAQLEADLFVYTKAEDELVSSVRGLASTNDWTQAMVALDRAGLGEMAKHLREIQLASLRIDYMSSCDM